MIDQIDVDSLSPEEIEALLPQLEEALKEAQKVPVPSAAKKSFKEEWSHIEEELNERFENSLATYKKELSLGFLIEAIFSKYLNEEQLAEFIESFQYCEKEQNFRKFKLPPNKPLCNIYRLGSSVYRLNKREIFSKPSQFYGTKTDLMRSIRTIAESEDPKIQSLVQDLKQTTPDYSDTPLLTL